MPKFLKDFFQKEALDLTPFVIRAQRGLRRDVKALLGALSRAKFFVPLAKRLDDLPLEGEKRLVLKTASTIYAHTLVHPETHATADVLFTRKEFLARFQDEWQTDGGQLEYCAVHAKSMLELVLQNLESGRSVCLVINPFHEAMLELTLEEVRALVRNEAIPLKRYVQELPIQEEGEEFLVGAPAVRPPKELANAVHGYVVSHPDLIGYDLFQMFNAERDTEAHLALNLLSRAGTHEPDIAHEMKLAIYGKVPPPGYLDILFNSKLNLPAGSPNIATYRKAER